MKLQSASLMGYFFILTLIYVVQGQVTAPAPSPIGDGNAIDQGIAYVLLLVGLVVTYLIH
ncbi:Arabinogalactan peptide 16 [Acorus gramineus]|uniref:Arabinogalactan peptide 16 n=1 Tax=Acorus gramineus TaxID=55184 RepID=A0AAV8ZYC4_ACOGR|nr:Arabinogalactan peptide 16 [Acorus gramineus]